MLSKDGGTIEPVSSLDEDSVGAGSRGLLVLTPIALGDYQRWASWQRILQRFRQRDGTCSSLR